ncbi:hypothetical protein DB42_AZ00560 [Neochlamydia sp. EPS4]|uniref:hypothetical protein n=1 Tax=Neochlamydia sp. EPS4 TaxID=1478175 RepID=UPI00058375AF|nr:hypothetical protein [Neochlamydia sp. EPS4]KIC74701.1 hypothetical protein DB42_AZ00560 [Neochlamydia sp. EPS4]
MASTTLANFQLINGWKPALDSAKWSDGSPKYLIDTSTGRKYWNEPKNSVRFKCFLLILGTPIVHSLASLVNTAYRIVKLASFSHFWTGKATENSYSFKGRLKDAGQDLLRVVTPPVVLVGLELAAIYGIFTPYNGRKLYASIERAQYGKFTLAPCFQPGPICHASGGAPQKRNPF